MAKLIDDQLKDIINDKDTIKVLSTLTPEGKVHAAVKQSLRVDEQGRLLYLEFFEKSQTNIDLVNSIWYDKSLVITLVTKERKSFLIKGKPVLTRVAGREYEKYYVEAEAADPENDLVAIYYIEPEEINEQTFEVSRRIHKEKYPLYVHLDKFAD